MKKSIKIILTVLAIIVGIILIDTIQAKLFNNSPILKIVENYNRGELRQKNKGILVDTYINNGGVKTTLFKWENYGFIMEERK